MYRLYYTWFTYNYTRRYVRECACEWNWPTIPLPTKEAPYLLMPPRLAQTPRPTPGHRVCGSTCTLNNSKVCARIDSKLLQAVKWVHGDAWSDGCATQAKGSLRVIMFIDHALEIKLGHPLDHQIRPSQPLSNPKLPCPTVSSQKQIIETPVRPESTRMYTGSVPLSRLKAS